MTSNPRIAVCSWSLGPDGPQHLVELLDRLDITHVQLALNPIVHAPALWRGGIDLLRGAGCTIVSGMMNTAGEDYSTLDTIRATGGVRCDCTWDENLQAARDIAELASRAGIDLVTFHAGFLPDDRHDAERTTMIDRLRIIADIFAKRHVNIAFETGQETADTLLDVLGDIDRTNLGINFDPANMILYGMGDPVTALQTLAPHVKQIHVKDARATTTAGQWGMEVPASEGDVHWPGFFELAESITPAVDYVIEREAGENRLADIRSARDLILRYTTNLPV